MFNTMDRRSFIRSSGIAGAALAAPSGIFAKSILKEKARIAFIGVGLRGCNHLGNLLNREDVEIPAICDIDPKRIEIAQKMIIDAKYPKAAVYGDHENSYKDLLARNDIDGVIISTPWLWHTPMAVDAMKAGKYTGVEVSAATTMAECWDLVDTHEETGVPLMILENVNYRRDVMAVMNMVREGLFGEMLHGRCGYQHDLRGVKFNDGISAYGEGVEFGSKGISEAAWRTQHSLKRNADLYPTHGLGPVAAMMDINRGNRFTRISSFATKSRGLKNYILNNPKGGSDHPNAKLDWKLGDIVTSTIETAMGETIIVTHDTNSPRPYSLGFRIQGTMGITEFDYYNKRLYVEGISEPHQWDAMDNFLKKYDHPLWKKYGEFAEGSGHGGMDFFVDNAFVEIVKRQEEAPLDAYDAAAWSAVTPLSEMSIAEGGNALDFPDFTRGKWIKRKRIFALDDRF
ncbi:MAG: Gfo/Idh/MocA family oxidoreductase [Bacteroidales bacterium]|nr:Gfo/Idh/MocA family oxidoreductase [Bacteroidales bacterium]MCF8389477.1 Gfo/Idh/MocA family oxidoreductase [Bacteroidales bacterium]